MKQLHIAVIGIGQMGLNHLKAYQKRDDVHLVGIVEADNLYARHLAKEHNCEALTLDDLPEYVDAVSIVSPSQTHYKIGAYLLSKGVHCLIEKPLAMNMTQSKELVDISKKVNKVLLVGHIEEYNTGFKYLRESLERSSELPHYISCERFNYGSHRVEDADVVLDLMIHDLGCVIDLLGPDVRYLEVLSAHGHGNKESVDMAIATLRARDCLMTFQASRLSHQRHREFILHSKSFSYFLNFISQQVAVYHNNQLTAQTSHPWMSPLEHEIDHFIECIRDPRKQPLTSGIKASITLKYVEEIQKKIYGGMPR